MIVVGGREHAMRREALDRERAGDADALVVLVGLVEEHLGVGVAGDGGVDLLARHALVDVGVVGDRLERDVRHALVDEALADVAAGRVASVAALPVSSASFSIALGRVGEQVVRDSCAPIRRVRASASATRLVSMVIQRRPHCSAT